MANYDFSNCLSPLDFEVLSKDLLEAELSIRLENFREGKDKGIDLRFSPVVESEKQSGFNLAQLGSHGRPPDLIVQCKRYSSFSSLKSELKNNELTKINKLNPGRYILTTSVSLSPQQVDELVDILSPYIKTSGDVYGKERLNSLLAKHKDVEKRHHKLWLASAGVLDALLNAKSNLISADEVERTKAAAKVYVKNNSYEEAIKIIDKYNVCIISGLPGIGKTTLARMLLLHFYRCEYDIVKISNDITEAYAYDYNNKPRFYYYDDFLGQTATADKLRKNEDQQLLDFMSAIHKSKKSVFVLTTREYILNQAKLMYEKLERAKFDHNMCIIDLSKYSRRIRAEILYNHLFYSDLPKNYVNALIESGLYLTIIDHPNYNPRVIESLTGQAWIGEVDANKYPDFFLQKLNRPVEIWQHAFRRQISPSARHLLYVLTTMPAEVDIRALEKAFAAFHEEDCTKNRLTLSASDYKDALKELDGTFVMTALSTDKSSNTVKFQNPSIRDFMKHELLEEGPLEAIILSMTFFEQARWIAATLEVSNLKNGNDPTWKFKDLIIDKLITLINSPQCSGLTLSDRYWKSAFNGAPNLPDRLSFIAPVVNLVGNDSNRKWVNAQIEELTKLLETKGSLPSEMMDSVRRLSETGYLVHGAGPRFVSILVDLSQKELEEVDDYDRLSQMVELFPDRFDEEGLECIRKAYIEFTKTYPKRCDLSNPENIREEATRIGVIGEIFKVDTEDTQTALWDEAYRIEEDEPLDDDRWSEDGQDGALRGECPDIEIESMFRTLGEAN